MGVTLAAGVTSPPGTDLAPNAWYWSGGGRRQVDFLGWCFLATGGA
jgi:hypothetical protein